MKPHKNTWIVLGNSNSSEAALGIEKLNFPCTFYLPPHSFSEKGELLIKNNAKEYTLLAGNVIELNKKIKNLTKQKFNSSFYSNKLWMGLQCNEILSYLKSRNHSIETWDKGVSLFYGLWHDSSHFVSEKILNFEEHDEKGLSLLENDLKILDFEDCKNLNIYNILSFLTSFMTLDEGDRIITSIRAYKKNPAVGNDYSVSNIFSVKINV